MASFYVTSSGFEFENRAVEIKFKAFSDGAESKGGTRIETLTLIDLPPPLESSDSGEETVPEGYVSTKDGPSQEAKQAWKEQLENKDVVSDVLVAETEATLRKLALEESMWSDKKYEEAYALLPISSSASIALQMGGVLRCAPSIGALGVHPLPVKEAKRTVVTDPLKQINLLFVLLGSGSRSLTVKGSTVLELFKAVYAALIDPIDLVFVGTCGCNMGHCGAPTRCVLEENKRTYGDVFACLGQKPDPYGEVDPLEFEWYEYPDHVFVYLQLLTEVPLVCKTNCYSKDRVPAPFVLKEGHTYIQYSYSR
ncbi:Hypothetical protein POVN_LOCUS51 [uncultured virus]|nr:Hypothetical protein POVN_LOCUS51 [uncultured virus]